VAALFIHGRVMSDSYSINEYNQVVPYTSGRRNSDTSSWREATELELSQRDEIDRLEAENTKLESLIERDGFEFECLSTGHDDRWCQHCDSAEHGVEQYQRWLLNEIKLDSSPESQP